MNEQQLLSALQNVDSKYTDEASARAASASAAKKRGRRISVILTAAGAAACFVCAGTALFLKNQSEMFTIGTDSMEEMVAEQFAEVTAAADSADASFRTAETTAVNLIKQQSAETGAATTLHAVSDKKNSSETQPASSADAADKTAGKTNGNTTSAKTSASDTKKQQTVSTPSPQKNENVTTPDSAGQTSGTLQGLTYEVQNGEVTITGFTADLPEVLVIPAEIGGRPVTQIGAYALDEAPIRAVTIPEGVRELGNNAFCFCESLETVSLPESIEKIGSHAFSMTKWLDQHPYSNDGKFIIEKNILLHADVCACRGDVIIPDGIRYIAGDAFFCCDAMTSVIIPDSVTGLGEGAFDGCSQMSSVRISAGLTEIGKYAFSDCGHLSAVSLPETLCSIGEGAFLGCDLLETVTFAAGTDGLTEIPFNAFRSCIKLKSARLPDSVTSIGDFAFFYCIELTDFALPPALTHLGENALNDCYALESLTIPETLTYIPEGAFTFCENVPEIIVPAGVTAVDAQAFWMCKKLEKITFLNPACTICDASDTISSEWDGGFAGIIVGYEGSQAQAYAAKYGYTFESLGAAPHR